MNKNNPNIDLGNSFETLKNDIMKVTIKRVIDPIGDPFFQVLKDDNSQGVFTYRDNEPEDSVYNEGRNLENAKKLAAKLEQGGTRVEEIIYQTPDDLPETLFQSPATN